MNKKIFRQRIAVCFFSVLLFCFGALALTACKRGGFLLVGNVSTQRDGKISMKYKKFDGEKSYCAEFKADETIAVTVETESGKLAMRIGKQGEEAVYEGGFTEDFSFTVTIKQPGTYTIYLSAKNHQGGFALEW